jgi:hypothetical protein
VREKRRRVQVQVPQARSSLTSAERDLSTNQSDKHDVCGSVSACTTMTYFPAFSALPT